MWGNDVQIGKYEVGEEVWDLLVIENLLITVRNLDVSIIELKQGIENKLSLRLEDILCLFKGHTVKL